jgi:extradiol dioxygenase family protein
LRQAKLGKPGYWTGKKRGPHTDEWKAAIGDGNRGRTLAAETKEAIRLALLGHKHSEATRQRIKEGLIGKVRSGPANHRWGKPPSHGQRIEYRGIVFRSSYEVRFAKALDRDGIPWEYEPKVFDLGSCTYRPDFYLPTTGAYWEVKGWLGPDSQRKTRLFRECHPEIPLIVATKPILELMRY